jgi:hypothetical protein
MAIELKELIAQPSFEGVGVFVQVREATETRRASFVFEAYGSQIAVEVEDSELLNPPAVGSLYQIVGLARRNNWNGTMSLMATGKRFVSTTVGVEHVDMITAGLCIKGCGKVETKTSTVVQRKTYCKATLKWCGAIHEFRSLSPEIYQRIPAVGSYVRFELGLLPSEQRNNETGQIQIVYKPTLLGIHLDVLAQNKPVDVATSPAKPTAPLPVSAKAS